MANADLADLAATDVERAEEECASALRDLVTDSSARRDMAERSESMVTTAASALRREDASLAADLAADLAEDK